METIATELLRAVVFAAIFLFVGLANIAYRKFFPKKTIPSEIESSVKDGLRKEFENVLSVFCKDFSITDDIPIITEVRNEYLRIVSLYKVTGKELLRNSAISLLQKTIATIRISRNVSTKDNEVLSAMYEYCNTLSKK